jgi:uncharacterized membrane protein YgdD (TMEM256/DUF423 family)
MAKTTITLLALNPIADFGTLFVLATAHGKWIGLTQWLFVTRTFMFCGALYLKALTSSEFPTRFARAGGLCLVGWYSLWKVACTNTEHLIFLQDRIRAKIMPRFAEPSPLIRAHSWVFPIRARGVGAQKSPFE